ncbi:MAG: HD domain-containing phosphohydrolase [Gemmatimonadota bacterium]
MIRQFGPRVLLVGPDAASLGGAQELVAALEDNVVVRWEITGAAGLAAARELDPMVILVGAGLTDMDAAGFCRRVRSNPKLVGTIVAFVSLAEDQRRELEVLQAGADVLLRAPVDTPALVAVIRLGRRFKQEQGREDGHVARLVRLLWAMVNAGHPAGAERAEQVSSISLALAAQFKVPMAFRRDLDVAARLRELGALLLPGDASAGPVAPLRADDRWRVVSATRAVLRHAPGLEGAAELLGAVYENWDGSGVPGHLDHGQIPLRSRMLRAAIDFVEELARNPAQGPEAARETLSAHAGTWYDPLVLIHLDAVIAENFTRPADRTRRRVAIDDLRPGMTLADDLFTSSGAKLLAAGAVVTPGTLTVIRRRHAADPILGAVWIVSGER